MRQSRIKLRLFAFSLAVPRGRRIFYAMRKTAFLTVAATFALLSTLAAKTYFKGVCDKDALSYKSGEEIVFSVSLIEDGKPKGGQKVKGLAYE